MAAGSAARGQEQPASRPESTPSTRDLWIEARKEWMCRHQSPDGRWSSVRFVEQCDPTLAPCGNPGVEGLDVGVTGLVLYVFEQAGFDSQRPGPYREAITGGLEYLEKMQDAEGRFGPANSANFAWSHACATLAMREDYARSNKNRWGLSAQAGLDAFARDDPRWPWNDQRAPSTESVYATSWALLALCPQADSLTVDHKVVRAAIRYLDRVADRETNATSSRTTDSRASGASSRSRASVRLTDCAIAAAFIARSEFAFATSDEDRRRIAHAREMIRSRFLELGSAPPHDLHASYFTTLAAFLEQETWPRWSEQVRKCALDRRAQKGCAMGSWDPSDEWTTKAGRVASTALMDLILIRSYKYRVIYR
jgi:hypothetical protein